MDQAVQNAIFINSYMVVGQVDSPYSCPVIKVTTLNIMTTVNSMFNSDAQCLQGMPYSLVKFTGAPDAQSLQGMPFSLVKFTGARDAQSLQGMPFSPVKFTGQHMPKVCKGCHFPQ